MASQRGVLQKRLSLICAVLFVGLTGPLAGCNGKTAPKVAAPVAPISNPPVAVEMHPEAVADSSGAIGNVAGAMTIAGPVAPHIGFISSDGSGGTNNMGAQTCSAAAVQ